MFRIEEVSFGKVPDYVRYHDQYPFLIGEHGDLKDVQRPWAYEKIAELVPAGSKVLDLGGAMCELASALSNQYSVSVVDPYEGAGSGPTSVDRVRKRFPQVNIIKGLLSGSSPIPGQDVVVSTSVVEHIDTQYHEATVAGITASLNPHGYSIHAIDVTCLGVRGYLEHTQNIAESWVRAHGVDFDIAPVVRDMLEELETYFLPVTMYMRWKKARPYNSYPWRKVGSLQVVLQKV